MLEREESSANTHRIAANTWEGAYNERMNAATTRFRSRFALGPLSLWYLVIPVFGLAAAQVCSSGCGLVSGNIREMAQRLVLPLPNVRLVFVEKSWSRYETGTDKSGRYEIKLPYGTYWTEVLKDGTCRIQRPDFRISPGEFSAF
jgi:hypothetical protein